MDTTQMTRVAIEARLEALASELTDARATVDALLDKGGASVPEYIKNKGRVELLEAEQRKLSQALPEARQRELDLAEAAADHVAKKARARFTARKAEVVQWLTESGWSGASDYNRSKIADQHDDVVALRGELLTADQNYARAARLAAAW